MYMSSHRKCQQKDWSSHKMKCRHGRPTPVGLPFVISLPSSQLTYSRLSSVAEKFARSVSPRYKYMYDLAASIVGA